MSIPRIISRAAPSAGAATVDFSGNWKNQLGSTMTLIVNGQKLSGTYQSTVSGGGGTIRGDLVGFVDGDLIAFTVNWTSPASLTSWTGQLVNENGRDVIKTLWLLVQNIPDANEPTGLWQSTFTGSDLFERV